MATGSRVNVRGLRELNAAFNNIQNELEGDTLKEELKKAAEPVRATAQQYALARVRNMPGSPEWADFRIGVSRREALVYMVPSKSASRRRGRRRKNLADLLSQRAMDPALDENQERVVSEVEDVLDRLARRERF